MSNMRVVLPSGTVVSVEYVKPITEQIIKFNGNRRRCIEYAKDMKKEANGICISIASQQGIGFGMGFRDIIVGNLTNKQVQEIIRQINEKGFYDFSQLSEYQKIDTLKDLKLGSEYPPYTSENCMMLSTGLGGNPFGGCGCPAPLFSANLDGDIFGSNSDYEDAGEDEDGDEYGD